MTCPECGDEVYGKECACGWLAPASVIAKATRRCGHCDKPRAIEQLADPTTWPCEHCGARSAWLCLRCGTKSPGGITVWEPTQQRVCGKCRFELVQISGARLQRLAAVDRCAEPDCSKTTAEHIAEFRRLVDHPSWLDKYGTKR